MAPFRTRCFGLAGAMLLAAAASPAWSPAWAEGSGPNPNYNPPPPKQGYSYPDCYCTDSEGQRVEMGETACLTIGQKQVLARCDMSVNSPTWRYETEGCPGV